MPTSRLLAASVAAGDTLTNSTTETVLGSHTFAADFFDAGKVIEFEAFVSIPSTNSTDELTLRARFGGTTLTGTAFIASAGVDVVNDDVGLIRGTLVCRDAGESVEVLGYGDVALDAGGSIANAVADGEVMSAVDTTAALLLEITGQWSVANASNQCALEGLVVREQVVG